MFTCFLNNLVREIPMSILRLSVTEMASRFHRCAENGFTAIAELECKDQFNNIEPGTIEEHLKADSEWLIARKWCRGKEVIWSVHHAHTKMDRAGKAFGGSFHCVIHDELVKIVSHELTNNNGCYSTGSLWARTNCIPMGGPFSAQGADLHLVWAAYTGRGKFTSLGKLEVTTKGWPVWHGRWGHTSMCQFRDNILLATDALARNRAGVVQTMREVLKSSWHLDVDCECISKKVHRCTSSCCNSVTKTVGVVMVLGLEEAGGDSFF